MSSTAVPDQTHDFAQEPSIGIGRSSGEPVWLALAPDPVLAFVHRPSVRSAAATSVLIYPPFGWNEMCSYRARRVWADVLAQAGYPAVRIDLPGTGDSGGSPRDPGRVEAWTAAVSASADWVRRLTGCERIVAVGIELGGILAWRAIAAGAAIDDLVLWGVPQSGQRLLHELRAQSSMLAGFYGGEAHDRAPLPEGDADLGGYLLTADTARALGAIELERWPEAVAEHRRVLLLTRGRRGADRRMRALLEQTGVGVTVSEVSGYEQMLAPPLEARPPAQAIAATLAWLAADGNGGGARPSRTSGRASIERGSIELSTPGGRVRETPLQFEIGSGRLVGVLAEPVAERAGAGLCAVLLPGGPMRHAGPSRTWVEIARRWAAMGVPTLRVDLEGIGDADGDHRRYYDGEACLYAPEMIEQTLMVLDDLERRGLPGRFVLVGLCSGAHSALHAALAGERVAAAMMLNLFSVFWSDEFHQESDTRHVLGSLRGAAWRRLLRGDLDRHHVRRLLNSVRPSQLVAGLSRSSEVAQGEAIDRAFDQLRDQGTQALILLGSSEPLYEQLARQGQLEQLDRWPNLVLARLPSPDHSFRALWVQREVHAHLDAALDRVLAASAGSGGS